MGLTRQTSAVKEISDKCDYTVALAGNPNVGKSTVFNSLTGLNQHTGNWPGKTVANATGIYNFENQKFKLVDLPGTYSLLANSQEEEIARNYIIEKNCDCIVIVTDATCLERNLNLVLQILSITDKVVVCVNLLDEAKKKGISIDTDELSLQLGVPVIGTAARSKKGLDCLCKTVSEICTGERKTYKVQNIAKLNFEKNRDKSSKLYMDKCEEIYQKCVKTEKENYNSRDRKLDKILTSKLTGIPVMLILLCLLFWITIVGANYLSQALSNLFSIIKNYIISFLQFISTPDWLLSLIIDGIYTTLSWIVAVMLPPMAIFFPLFSLLEDSGYLPRIAFNMDKFFKKCDAHGKQSLTMAMGFGCNACGVIGCRIIESPREKLIAILTNNFVPCNGRLPTLIAIITMFFATTVFGITKSIISALILLICIIIAVAATLLVSKLLSKTILKGYSSSFILELPPYRRPQILKTIIYSFTDRTLFVLGRAVIVAIPAGVIIWCLANLSFNDISLLKYCTDFFDPFGNLIGLDGVIIMALLLAFPANEIFIPSILMAYMAQGTLVEYTSLDELFLILSENGWTVITAICVLIMCLFHFPCSTTCLTIQKETKSFKWTLLSMALPTLLGIILCFIVSTVCKLF